MSVHDEAPRRRADERAGEDVRRPVDVVIQTRCGNAAGDAVRDRGDDPAVRMRRNHGG